MRKLPLASMMLLMGASVPASARPSLQEQGEAALAKELAGRVPGKPVHCLSLDRIDGSTIIDGTAIIYRGLGGTVWVNRPRGADMLREDDVVVEEVYGSQLCNLDQIKLVDRDTRMQRGFVGLNDFVPYTKAAKVAR